MTALFYLFWRQFANSFRRALKTPRILIPGVIILFGMGAQLASYLLVYYLNPERGTAGAMPTFTPNDLLMGKPGAFVVAVRGALLFSVFTAVVTALGEGNLFFQQGDIDFLFPAPLSRRGVLFFKMLSRYLSLLLVASYLSFTLGLSFLAAQIAPVALLPGVLGVWLFLIAVNNAAQATLLNRAPDVTEDAAGKRRGSVRRIVTFVFFLFLGLILYIIFGREKFLGTEVVRAVNNETFSRTLLPDSWAAELFRTAFTGWKGADTARLFGLAALCAASFVWLFSRERDFYESAIDFSAKRSRALSAVQRGDSGSVLSQLAQEGKLARGRTLPDFGVGAWAVFWKDCISATRIPIRAYLQLLIPAAMPALLGGYLGRGHSEFSVLGWTFFFALQMPGVFLMGLRDMLRRADISRALPIHPLRYLIAEIALPIGQLTILGWLSLGVSAALGLWRGPLLSAAFITLPTLTALLYFVQTAFVLLYPRPNDMAQTIISNLLSLLVSLFAVLPGVIIGIILYIADFPPLWMGVPVAAVNLCLAALALTLAGALWARFDPTD